ncbi:uroporphyrinogen-III C-methyltransferase [Hyphomonas sp. CACIAM 19H1]|uniref:siroheme synthase CysG n=1 Tax=Hyphomonas sp. CACIAM 19H1 TaxID=1873716 RepID=UPI000DED3884|nr:siroheme synthase CysG [Hyphomonas sp. CACIAM 19H1]AXE62852.1 uroporphyrinogen-III C-methyltransferase [Hyphomonas sp. CACIAM 19H1]
MRQFPAFFNLEGARIVVFGGGEEAARKLRLFHASGAEVVLVGGFDEAALAAEFDDWVDTRARSQIASALEGARLAIIAEESPAHRAEALAAVRARNIPVNVVDQPEDCDFTVPSILDRGEIVAAIGSGGAAPVLAKSIRAKLEALLPQRIGDLAALARSLRGFVGETIPDKSARRRYWERALSGPAAEAAYAGDLERAEALLRQQARAAGRARGVVHIVGAGPGDPELLTLKALRLIQEADVVYYDRLVSPEIIGLIRRDAARVPVGKSKGDHSVPQTEIHERLIASAREGLRVVRLKGGDPFIFGRGGEELEAVRAEGIEVHVVPGISSALGCAASAGVPLTHRDHAQTLTFVTGHAKAGGVPDLDWQALARPAQTVVVFMGVDTAPAIAEKLVAAGRAPTTPVAVIENGTRPDELRVFGTLAELPFLVEEEGIAGPALLIIGEVAGLPAEQGRIAAIVTEASGLAWFSPDARQHTFKESAA